MKERLPAGARIARFQIYARISANGIGEVYQATEIASGSELALKLLPAALMNDPNTRERFVQTFASIARLRRPRLCQVYEAGISDDGRPYVAMEYVKGQSLDLASLNQRLSIPEIISIVLNVAEALETLHTQGWTHLAIKPANLMVTSDLQIKILDFGIGLVFPRSPLGAVGAALTVTPGAARYLSPEQLSGARPDQRSDVFGLGAVLYEMLAGRPPFSGSSLPEIVAAVTLTTPRSILDFRENASAAVNEIVLKALAKDPKARYQTMGALAGDLRRLPEMEPALHRNLPGPMETLSEITPESESSFLTGIRYFCGRYKYQLLTSVLALAAIAVVILAMGILRDLFSDPVSPQLMQTTFLTTEGKARNAAISPDGARLICAMDEGDRQTLVLKELKTGKETRLASAQASEYHDLAFSPDGRWVNYYKAPAEEVFPRGLGAAYRILAQGGAEQPLRIPNAIGAASFSPDGRSLAAVRMNGAGETTSLWIGDETGKGADLITRASPAAFQSTPPAWSPDGRVIVCVTREADSDFFLHLVAVKVENRAEHTLVSGRFSEIDQVIWRADGSGLIIAASDPIARKSQLWRVDYPSGAVSRITRDWSDYRGVSMTQDESVLISVQREAVSNVWVAPVADIGRLRQITKGRLDGLNGMAWAPDGGLTYVSITNNRESLWIVRLGNDEDLGSPIPQPLPVEIGDGGQYQPTVSPDGQSVAYVIERGGGAYLLNARMDPRELIPVSNERLAFFPQFLPDGGSILYSAIRREQGAVARVSANGGSPETLIAGRVWRAVVSPDGKNLACNYLDESTTKWRVAVLSISGGEPLAVFDAPGDLHRVVQWTSDGTALAFIVTRAGVSNLWAQPIDGGAPSQLTDFKTNRIFNFAWSRDGRRLALAQGWTSNDVALIQNFR
jgi:serine/threonine protein kinase/Tol biopolymer transport system component